MMLLFLMTLFIMMMFSLTNSPLMMVFLILIQTIILGMMINLFNNLFWMSYILILIFLGGMLVIFIYIASLTSNEKMKWNLNKYSLVLKTIFIIMILLLITNYLNTTMYHCWNMNMNNSLKHLMSMNKMYMENMMMVTLFLAAFLMITLFIIVKISNFNKGPLRKK